MKEYPYIKCLNPRRITNIWTGDDVVVECGKCEHCILKKSLARTIRVKLESAVHKYFYFVTTTFDNDNLPCARLVQVPEKSNIIDSEECYDVVRESDGIVLGQVMYKDNITKNNLIKKFNAGHNRVPILDSSYPIKFLKRLRKRIKNEKIRTFYCGEYGPVHFRPHYHFAIWFDQEETLANIRQAISESWTFGIVDSSLASGKAASYIASYLNCTCYLPKVLTLPSTSPFSNHSWYLGEQLFACSPQEIQEGNFKDIIERRICFNGLNTEVILWRSFKGRLFPKLKGYAGQSEYVRVLSYSAYAIIRNWTQENRPINQARFITDYVRFSDFYHPDTLINDLLQLFRYGLNYYETDSNGQASLVIPALIDYDKFERNIYSHILKSRYFLKTFCNGHDDFNSVRKHLRIIDDFYKFIDSDNLKKQFDVERKICKDKDADMSLFFHNTLVIDKLKESRFFQSHSSLMKNRYSSYMKHKELNDKNKIFNY